MNGHSNRLAERPRVIAALAGVAALLFVFGILVGGAGGSDADTGDSPPAEESLSPNEAEALESELRMAETEITTLEERVEGLQKQLEDKGEPKEDSKNGGRKKTGERERNGRRNGNRKR